MASVNWVSIDRPFMSGQVGLTTFVRDEFSQESYSNNNGLESWATNWTESNDDGNPGYGDIKITGSELMLKDDNRAIQRSANLYDAVTAALSFDYRRFSFDNASDYVAIQISTNGGANWTELGRLAGPASDSNMQAASYDITDYVPNTIIIRLATSSYLSDYDRLYIDNLQIEFERSAGTPDPAPSSSMTVLDQFNTETYTNNNGTANWSGNWIEVDDGSALLGVVQANERV